MKLWKLNKEQKIYFVFIFVICILAIGIAVYSQVAKKEVEGGSPVTSNAEKEEQLRQDFDENFTNTVQLQNANLEKIKKIDDSKDIITMGYERVEKESGKYELDVQIPQINSNHSVLQQCNKEIRNIFEAKAEAILQKVDNYTIYNVKYTANMNDSILSIAIKSTLKEGSAAQRVIIKTYNYDVNQEKLLTCREAIAIKNITESDMKHKVQEEIMLQNKQAEALEKLGYYFYKRDITSDSYDLDNTTNFFFDKDRNLYLIYAYGNTKFTSERDIIVFL